MRNEYELRLARESDLDGILGLIAGASAWLAGKGTDQWQRPWPDRPARDARIRAAIRAGKTWVLADGDVAVATLTADWQGYPARGLPELWSPEECAEPAVYAHRMAVRRGAEYQGRGFGGQLLDTVGRLGLCAYGAEHVRLDAWSTNYDLHTYYKGRGFDLVRIYDEEEIDCPSGALFQKPAARFRDTAAAFAVNSADAGKWSAHANAARVAEQRQAAGTEQ
ncbi:MAG TPA: GNAT family N-acetyltransferase [Streptosporangiaceae bacterium]|jgi:GNAT superfamily N-acetyltransferase